MADRSEHGLSDGGKTTLFSTAHVRGPAQPPQQEQRMATAR
jgi:hypothetical protein